MFPTFETSTVEIQANHKEFSRAALTCDVAGTWLGTLAADDVDGVCRVTVRPRDIISTGRLNSAPSTLTTLVSTALSPSTSTDLPLPHWDLGGGPLTGPRWSLTSRTTAARPSQSTTDLLRTPAFEHSPTSDLLTTKMPPHKSTVITALQINKPGMVQQDLNICCTDTQPSMMFYRSTCPNQAKYLKKPSQRQNYRCRSTLTATVYSG